MKDGEKWEMGIGDSTRPAAVTAKTVHEECPQA
jgi:hypothetical protein